jgi:muramoyltetrapeptide carboxypeptidase
LKSPVIPPFLKPGDTIKILSTARKISYEELKPSIALFESWGLNVKTGKTIDAQYNQFAGDDHFRSRDFQEALDDPDVKAIVCGRGGYGTARMIDLVDFSKFRDRPKWIVGFSDVTVLHSHILTNCGVATIHACMPIQIYLGTHQNSTESLRRALFGETLEFQYKIPDSLKPYAKPGKAEAMIAGGNLSILYSLSGTPSQLPPMDMILFLEDLDEYLYHIDRMMNNLYRSGQLDRLQGLIIGGFTSMKDNEIPFGQESEEIIFGYVKEKNIPVAPGFPAGHTFENVALILGHSAILEVDEEKVVLKQNYHGHS